MSDSTSVSKDPDSKVDRAFSVKATVYAKGLYAGIGIKASGPGLLKQHLADNKQEEEELKQKILGQAHQALSDNGVKNFQEDALQDAVETFLAQVRDGSGDMVARKVAEGQAPEPGEDGKIEYSLNPDDLPMHKLEDLPPNSKKRWFHFAQEGETLARAVPASQGKPGSDVRGETMDLKEKAKEPSLTAILGENTSIQGDTLVADCDGMCEENINGRIRVVPEIVIDAVDAQTGSLPEAGLGKASILIKKDIKSQYRVATSETIFVGLGESGNIESKSAVEAANLVVNGIARGVYKEPSETTNPYAIQIQELFISKTVDGRHIVANNIFVFEDCLFGLLDAEQAIRVGGNVSGGCMISRNELAVCGNLGTKEGGSRTRVLIPGQGETSRSQKRVEAAMAEHEKTSSELGAKLDQLEASSAKRAKSDAYWASLAEGEFKKPGNPVQANTARQFRDMLNEKKELKRSISAAKTALTELKERAEEAQDESTSEVLVRVMGWIYLDAEFEAALGVEEEDLERVVTYSVEGKKYRNHSLQDLNTLLTKLAKEHLEAEQSRVGERKQAIEQMFEGAEKKPTGPQINHKRFEVPFEWSGDDAQKVPQELRIATLAFVESQDPESLRIKTIATVREEIKGVQVKISNDGPKTLFLLEQSSSVEWRDRSDVKEMLDSRFVHGLSAKELLDGKTSIED